MLVGITPEKVGRMCRRAWKAASMLDYFSATMLKKASTVYGKLYSPDKADMIAKKLNHKKSMADKLSWLDVRNQY